MSTNANIVIKKDGQQIVRIYVHWDGYPSGVGMNIKSVLNNGNVKIVNGIRNDKTPSSFNGIGCLAAYLIGALKDNKIGNVYIDGSDKTGDGVEWEYVLSVKDGRLHFQVTDIYAKSIAYSGELKDFDGELVEKEVA